MIDGNQADDKIIAVLDGDVAYGAIRDIGPASAGMLDRLQHYFLTYKQMPGAKRRAVEIPEVYDRAEAQEMIRLSQADYHTHFGDPAARIPQLRALLKPEEP